MIGELLVRRKLNVVPTLLLEFDERRATGDEVRKVVAITSTTTSMNPGAVVCKCCNRRGSKGLVYIRLRSKESISELLTCILTNYILHVVNAIKDKQRIELLSYSIMCVLM